jgi:drug/metabolite transporter (DMT)-like permease
MLWFTLATCSALLSAVSAVLQKRILRTLDAVEFSFSVSLTVVVLSSFIPFTTDLTAITPNAMAIIVGKSILGASAFLLVMMSLRNGPISSALPLLGLTPAATALVSFLITGEGIRPLEWAGIGLMFTGAAMLDIGPGNLFLTPLKTILATKQYYYALGAVALFAFSSVFDKILVSGLHIKPLSVLFYQHVIYTVLFFSVLVLRRYPYARTVRKAGEQWKFIAAVAVLTLAYRFTQLEATVLAPVALVLAVKRTSILYASFFGGKMFSEERLKHKLIAAALIVAAGFMILRNVG